MPETFFVIPLWNTSKNTVDGGCAYVYCYDKDNNYLGMATGGNGFIKQRQLVEGTAKIKISLRFETRTDPVIAITKRTLYSTYEFGACITVTDSENIELNGVVAKDAIGDIVTTFAPPIDVTVNDFRVINCVFENARRQGISYVATGENYLVKDSYIGNINGTDPQSGIDIEHYDYVRNVVIDGTNFYNNKKLDIINYNGVGIEIKNCNFLGSVGTTYGHTMDVHDNIFGEATTGDGKKLTNVAACSLNTDNNKVYNNKFIGSSCINSGNNCQTYYNIYIDSKVTVTSGEVNKYYNCEVGIRQKEGLVIDGSYFENCNVFCHNDSPALEVINCEFENSSFEARGPVTVKKCKFNLVDKHLMSKWKTEATDAVFDTCDIVSKLNFIASGSCFKATFNNCNITTSRENLIQYGITTFNNSHIKFLQLGDENEVLWNTSGYGYERCPWYFTNCTFESQLPVAIGGGNVVNPIIIGNIVIK